METDFEESLAPFDESGMDVLDSDLTRETAEALDKAVGESMEDDDNKCEDGTGPGPGSAPIVLKLSQETSSALRKGQIVSKISDVVRELVDNAVDAGASSVQVLLTNFGINKIEVKDSGHGIEVKDSQLVVAGGYTSKLKDTSHISCGDSYGFRGEALSSICSVANVSVITKTAGEQQARKYVFDYHGRIVSESKVAFGKGTSVIVEKIFANFPVRRQWIQDKSRRTAEIKEIENYLKGIGIANFSKHISLYHEGTLIWSKASVPTIDQAIITVLGYPLAKNLVRCGPCSIHVGEDFGGTSEHKSKLEAFLLKRPIDMKTMSFTKNIYTFIFVNRKRVYLREFEKLIQQYNVAVLPKPAPADFRRFPVAVVNLVVPSNEVDFNRDMDKSKIFLVYKDEIKSKLEELLKQFYQVEVDTNVLKEVRSNLQETPSSSKLNKDKESENIKELALLPTTPQKCYSQDMFLTSPVLPQSNNDSNDPHLRRENILEFLGNMPSISQSNFSRSPSKEPSASACVPELERVQSVVNCSKDPVVVTAPSISEKDCVVEFTKETVIGMANQPSRNPVQEISNFEIDIDDLLELDFPPSEVSFSVTTKDSAPKTTINSISNIKDWVHGRMRNPEGEVIENVVLHVPEKEILRSSGPVCRTKSAAEGPEPHEQRSRTTSGNEHPTSTFSSNLNPWVIAQQQQGSVNSSGSKRRRMSGSLSNFSTPNGPSFSSKPRQVTLDSYENWPGSGRRLSEAAARNASCTRLQLSSSSSSRPSNACSRKSDNATGLPPKSVRDYWSKPSQTCEKSFNDIHYNNHLSSDVWKLRKTICSENLPSSQKSREANSQGNTVLASSKLISAMEGTGLYTAHINNQLGVFCPIVMLNAFPSLKYDLKITILPQQGSSSTPSSTMLTYGVSPEDASKLFDRYIQICNENTIVPEPLSKCFIVLHEDLDILRACDRKFLRS